LSEWFETFFDALAHDVWDALVPDDASDQEANYLAARLGLADGARRALLDVPSGRGRLARRVAAQGHDVVAVDLAPAAVEPLAAGGTGVDARLGDMRELPTLVPASTFDGAWCMGNSFGYLDPGDTHRFLAGIAHALRPGARLVLDAATVAESLLPHLEPDGTDRHEAGDVSLTNTHRYDAPTSTLVTRMVLACGSERAERVARHRVMTCREVVEGLARANLRVELIEGDLDGRRFTLGAPRCLVTAVRVDERSPG
jgi:SAM-dependent methyltransferase